MLTLTNVVAGRTRPTTYTAGDAILQGGSSAPYQFLWCATARTNENGNTTGTKFDEATRTATTCFMRGLQERVEIQTSSSIPWQWRRILFTAKGVQNALTTGGNFWLANLTSNGYRRTVNEVFGVNQTSLNGSLFSGAEGSDWDDPMVAKVDARRVTVLYDKIRTIASGNASGVIRRYKFWHAFNKNLVYSDDEVGGQEAASQYSTLGKPGMGDVYVVDIIKPLGGSVSGDQMLFRPNSTLYWHEK